MKNIFYAFAVLLLITACDSKPTLQKYFVDNAEAKDFVTVDVSPSLIKTDSIQLTQEEKTAVASLRDMNVLIFKADSNNRETFEQEKLKVKGLLKTSSYGELMKFNSGGQGASVSTLGEGKHIDEIVVYLYNKENGFGLVRILGNDMTPDNVLTMIGLIQKANLNLDQLKPLQELMKK